MNIFLRTGRTDMRKQIPGMSVLVLRELRHNPLSGNLFVYYGRTRRILRVLHEERNGCYLWSKRPA